MNPHPGESPTTLLPWINNNGRVVLFDALRAAAAQTPTTTFEKAHPGAAAPAALTG